MATLENIFVSICIIGLCILVAAAVIAIVVMMVISLIGLAKEMKDDGK